MLLKPLAKLVVKESSPRTSKDAVMSLPFGIPYFEFTHVYCHLLITATSDIVCCLV